MRILIALFVAGAALGSGPANAAGGPEPVEIPSGEGRLKALLYRPEGNGPFPAVIGLHNCVGLTNRSGVTGSRYLDWGGRLARSGFAVLLPDSNGSRGLGSQCAVRGAACGSIASGSRMPMPRGSGCSGSPSSIPIGCR